METNTMTVILTSIGEFFTQAVSWVGDLISLITSEPLLLLMCVSLPICSFVVCWLKRLIRV